MNEDTMVHLAKTDRTKIKILAAFDRITMQSKLNSLINDAWYDYESAWNPHIKQPAVRKISK